MFNQEKNSYKKTRKKRSWMFKMKKTKIKIEDRISGAFTGLYFGSGVNPRFSPMLTPEKARELFSKRKFGDYFSFPFYGQTKIVYDMLMKFGKITPELSRDYLMELHKKYDVFKGDVYGPSTQKAITKILAGEDVYEMGKTGITCGSAMKCLPIAMFFHNNMEALVENTVNTCIISHNTDVTIDAAIACNITLASLINGVEKFEAIKKGIDAVKKYHGKFGEKTSEPRIDERIETALKLLKGKSIEDAEKIIPEKIGVSWFARETIPGAFANYIVSNSPEDSSLLAMRCGGDNQTVPEIACAFLGAEKGSNIFSEEVLKNIEKINKIKIDKMAGILLNKLKKLKK